MEPLLEVKNLTKIFDLRGKIKITAADAVSFRLYPHETLGIVGESGSGKTTVAKVITGLVPVSSGAIFLHGKEITHLKGRERRGVYGEMQMVFQSPAASFDPRRTLGDGIGESLRNRGMSRRESQKTAAALLGQCGLPGEYISRYPHEVSGGQCQRAAIARALAIGPKLLICDEATSALDVTVQKQILELLRDLKERYGMAYLFICHDLALVQSFCDRVLVMDGGRIVEEGPPDEVISNPQGKAARRLVEAASYFMN